MRFSEDGLTRSIPVFNLIRIFFIPFRIQKLQTKIDELSSVQNQTQKQEVATLRQELEESREKFDDITKQHHLDVAKIKRINEEKLEKLEQELETAKNLYETSKRQFATEREIEIQEQASLKVRPFFKITAFISSKTEVNKNSCKDDFFQ